MDCMNTDKLFWIPRVLTIIFILLLSFFAMDSFSGESSTIEKLKSFLIHLIPSFILTFVLIIFWKKPLHAGSIFIILSLILTYYFGTYGSIQNFFIISLPVTIIGVLFIVFYFWVRKKQG